MTTAANLLNVNHPAHPHFVQWCRKRGTEPTKRQARRFLDKFPNYRGIKG